MTTYTGNDGVIQVASSALGEVVGWTLDEKAEPVEDTVLGDSNRTYKAGLGSVEGSIECRWDKGDTQQTALYSAITSGAAVTLDLRPEGTGSSLTNWNFDATILSASTKVAFNEMISATFTFSAQGAVDRTPQA